MNPRFHLSFNHVKVVVRLIIFSIFVFSSVTSVSTASANQLINQPCGSSQQSISLEDGPVPPTVVSPGTRSEDADWPVLSRKTFAQKDASGKEYTTTVTVRRNPHPIIPKSNESATLLAEQYCTLLYQESIEVSDTKPIGGGLTQYLKNYYNLYDFTYMGNSFRSYHTYRTELRWTRTGSSFTLGSPSIAWLFRGNDCSNTGVAYTQSGGGFTPTWYNGTSTWVYVWTFMDSWATMSPVGGVMRTTATATGFRNGVQMTPNLSTAIYYSQ